MNMQAMKAVEAAGPRAGHVPVILLVEDEMLVREVTRQVLQHAGYMVLESSGPGEALRLVSQHQGRIDLLLTDVVMPEMNGTDLASRLQDLRPQLRTVFMSGYAESDIAQSISRMSALHIQKPFTVDGLLSRIVEALRTSVPVG